MKSGCTGDKILMIKRSIKKSREMIQRCAEMIAVGIQVFCMLLICLTEADTNELHVETRSYKYMICTMILSKMRKYAVAEWYLENFEILAEVSLWTWSPKRVFTSMHGTAVHDRPPMRRPSMDGRPWTVVHDRPPVYGRPWAVHVRLSIDDSQRL